MVLHHIKFIPSCVQKYNEDLEKLVDTLRDKLEGSVLREEHLTEKLHEANHRTFKVALCFSKNTSTNICLAYYTSYQDARQFVEAHCKDYREHAEEFSKYAHNKLGIYHPNVFDRWVIEQIPIGVNICMHRTRIEKVYFNLQGDPIEIA